MVSFEPKRKEDNWFDGNTLWMPETSAIFAIDVLSPSQTISCIVKSLPNNVDRQGLDQLLDLNLGNLNHSNKGNYYPV